MTRRQKILGILYAVALVWINAYICRNWFFAPTVHMNSMHGFWAALARLGDGWFHSTWWPYWDCGIPFEFTYAPLVPGLAQLIATVAGVPHIVAFQWVSAIAYCLLPVSLFVMAWALTRSPGYAFAAGLALSLLSPTELLAPDGRFAWNHLWDARRLMLQGGWDETPHYLGLVFLPIIILFLARAFEKRKPLDCAAAAVAIAVGTLASYFTATATALAAICLLATVRPLFWRRNLALVAGIGAFAWALAAPFLAPSIVAAVRTASALHEPWSLGSFTALAAAILGGVVLANLLPRWTKDWRLQFFALFAWAEGCSPLLFQWLGRRFLPQLGRYKIEMELALALVAVFALKPGIERLPRGVKAALVLLLVALSAEQVASHRKYAKDVLASGDFAPTIEYRTAERAARELPGVRVMLPGSIAQWANAFTDVPQFSGSSWSMAYNQTHELGKEAIYAGDPAVSLSWLKAYGVGAVAVSGPSSREFWKPYANPAKFDGLLPALWTDNGVTMYRVPGRSASLAHVVPRTALVAAAPRRISDTAALARYDSALDDPALPEAALAWHDRDEMIVRTSAAPGQVLSLQVSYHPGWHATAGGRSIEVHSDGLGLMWLRPPAAGPLTVELTYNGGWEFRLCRWLSFLAWLSLVVLLGRAGISLRRRSARQLRD